MAGPEGVAVDEEGRAVGAVPEDRFHAGVVGGGDVIIEEGVPGEGECVSSSAAIADDAITRRKAIVFGVFFLIAFTRFAFLRAICGQEEVG